MDIVISNVVAFTVIPAITVATSSIITIPTVAPTTNSSTRNRTS